ncbi:MAG: hypothetical protein ABSC64_20230 [Candidatus Korobacteraceae bacterium]
MLDANASSNADVRQARAALVRTLVGYGARVRVANVPAIDGVNGPDDLIARAGDAAMQSMLDLAAPALDVAIADAEAAIEAIRRAKNNRKDVGAEQMRNALDCIADVSDKLTQDVLKERFAAAVRGVISKAVVTAGIADRRKGQDEKRSEFAKQTREAELMARPVDKAKLIAELDSFFAERAHLPQGAALVFAYFALNTWTFGTFETTPYISLESATPRCGKTTVLKLLKSVTSKPEMAAGLSEAVMFRLIDQKNPTLLVDEAEFMNGPSERALALRQVAQSGNARGGKVYRCIGDDHVVGEFNVYCPQVYAAIGGLKDALLDRCIVIHMERAPKGSKRKSCRARVLARDCKALVEHLEAYAVQIGDKLTQLYDAEPDQGYWPDISDREADIWGPLLYHSRLIGTEAESALLNVYRIFNGVKEDIQSGEYHVAKALAILDALEKLPGESFTPGDLLDELIESDAWAETFAKVPGKSDTDIKKARSVRVGYVLRSYLLKGVRRGGKVWYGRQAALNTISLHVPENYPNYPNPPKPDYPTPQSIENTGDKDSQDSQDSFWGGGQGDTCGRAEVSSADQPQGTETPAPDDDETDDCDPWESGE